MSMIEEQAGKAAPAVTVPRSFLRLFRKPKDAVDPAGSKSTHRTIAIIATGGTFLCSDKVKPRTPQYHENLFEFIKASNLGDYFQRLGLYQDDDKYFLPDGTEIVYKPLRPSIDSTNARYIERHKIATTIRELQDTYTQVDAMVIHGTDTAAQTAQFLDLQFGREADIGIAVVTSQEPADAIETDAHGQFKTAFKALHERIFGNTFIVSNNGTEIFSGISAKITDVWSAIYTGTLIGRSDRGMIMSLIKSVMGIGQRPERVKIPALAAFSKAIIKDFTPQGDGVQDVQALNAADEINDNRKKAPSRRYNAIVLHTAGSGNFPDYADPILTAADNELPVFALSEVPGAVTLDAEGIPKYSVSAVAKAQELKLNNLIMLPATRPGLDMRASSILAFAATYAKPRTPEFLLLCHIVSAIAWTPEDQDEKSVQITGNRQDLVELRETLDEVYANLPDSPLLEIGFYSGQDLRAPPYRQKGDSYEGRRIGLKNDSAESRARIQAYKEAARELDPDEGGHFLYDEPRQILIDQRSFDHRAAMALQNARVLRLLKKHVPHLVDSDGHYQLEDIYNEDENLIVGRKLRVNQSYYGNIPSNDKRPEARHATVRRAPRA
jgi:L-asparaginase/Glu-tRNA(Gln) amidotransferase subunit D